MEINLGTLVIVLVDFTAINVRKYMVGICYEEYNIGQEDYNGRSIIFESGGYDGFSPDEQKDYLQVIGQSPQKYDFKNVVQLSKDFKKGIFDFSIEQATRAAAQLLHDTKLRPKEQQKFSRMYPNGIYAIKSNEVSWALKQIRNTLSHDNR